MQKQTTMLGCPARQHVLQDIKLLADEFIFTSLQRWKQVPAHTREYIRQELADNGIDIERVLATAEPPSNHICAPEEKFLSIREAARLAKCSRATIVRRIKDKSLIAVKLSPSKPGAVRIAVASFEAWMDCCRGNDGRTGYESH